VPRVDRVWILAVLFFFGYSAWSLVLYREYQSTGYDLGIFEQAVRSYASGHWPTSDLKGPGFPLLGDHFSPILAVLAPFYLLHRSATTLLVAQAFLLAVSVVPVTRLAGPRNGVLVGVAYGLSWGLLHAIRFDFHEICFAVPLLAFGLERLVRRQWTAAVWWVLPLVLVKEDLPWTVVAVGLYVVSQGQRRLGLLVAAFGSCVGVLLVSVVLPSLNPSGRYAYWSTLDSPGGPVWLGLSVRLGTVAALLAPTAFLAVRSSVVLIGLPSLVLRFVSGNPAYWGTDFHYNAVLMPVLFVAFVDVLRRVSWARLLVPLCLVVAVGFAVPTAAVGNGQPVWTSRQAADADAVLAEIPDGASAAASNRLVPHLTGRCRVSLFPWRSGSAPEWVAVALPSAGWPVSDVDEARLVWGLSGLGFRRVVSTGNVELFRRGG